VAYMQVTTGLLAIATPREVQEMDIALLLELPTWLEDECEFDIINLTRSVCHTNLVLVIWTSKCSCHH
jgi:hypothetical protein